MVDQNVLVPSAEIKTMIKSTGGLKKLKKIRGHSSKTKIRHSLTRRFFLTMQLIAITISRSTNAAPPTMTPNSQASSPSMVGPCGRAPAVARVGARLVKLLPVTWFGLVAYDCVVNRPEFVVSCGNGVWLVGGFSVLSVTTPVGARESELAVAVVVWKLALVDDTETVCVIAATVPSTAAAEPFPTAVVIGFAVTSSVRKNEEAVPLLLPSTVAFCEFGFVVTANVLCTCAA